ncbi:MAG TPA: glycosyltransferase, partial [Stellaceae bacterium]|nr:glycosyltransferase [Stellaceae bacterium]
MGGKIHFLHYPSEEEWNESLPLSDQRRMVAEWDAYYVSPVTRPLYTRPAGQDHTIDEWWDPGIGEMLEWLFRVQTFDVFIVNYAWLSKAFEHAPPGVVKVLDTHDRFSGRRVLFEAHGMAPDYFHIREDDERVALQRADVVWAIKPQEEQLFRGNTDRKVLTLLHAEPLATSWPRRCGEVLRFGIAGSGNEINIANFRRFLEVAAEYIRVTLLPCEFVLAGSCCDGLGQADYPFVRQMGRLQRMDDFYDAVDVVLGPMEFSTGLKIRIGEAMSRGKAIVAHRHCFEGYQPMHPFHALASFEEMMRACRDIVRAPRLIEELEGASIESMTRALRSVDSALEATLAAHRKVPKGFVFVVEPREISQGSVVLDHLCEAAAYVGHQCRPIFFLDGDSGASDTRSLARLGKFGTVMFSKRSFADLAEKAEAIAGMRADPTSFEELLSGDQLGFWFARLPERIPPLRERNAALAFVPLSVLALRVGETRLVEFLGALKRSFAEVVAMDAAGSRLLAVAAGLGVTTRLVPSLWCTELSDVSRAMEEAKRETITFFTARPNGVLEDLAY